MVWLATPLLADVAPAACDGARRDAWDRARAPTVARYCDLLAQAFAAIDGDPSRAEAAAAEADKLSPGRAAPLVLLARAATSADRFADAVELFRRAQAVDPHAGEDAGSTLALATALARTGDRKGAVVAFRALIPRSPALPPARRTRARLQAGLAILGEGPEAVTEAVGILRAAARDAAPELSALADTVLALALDRQGSVAEARALVARASAAGAQAVVTAQGFSNADTLALTAMLRDEAEPARGVAAWEAFLAAGGGPWASHARAKLAARKPTAAPGRRR